MSASDMELLDAWRRGNLEAGEELFERYYHMMVRFFSNKLQDSIADLVQQTFMACVEGRDRMRKTSSFRSYLFAVAHNKFRAHLRSRYRSARGSPDSLATEEPDFETLSIQDIAPGPSTLVVRHREQRLLLEALRHIPVDYQLLIELRYWEQLKTIEIAEIIGAPHATVRSRLRLAHGHLKREMGNLAGSSRELESTVTRLEDWARLCREQVFVDQALASTESLAPE